MAALKDMLGQHGARDAVLDTFAGIRADGRDPAEVERIDRTRPQEPML